MSQPPAAPSGGRRIIRRSRNAGTAESPAEPLHGSIPGARRGGGGGGTHVDPVANGAGDGSSATARLSRGRRTSFTEKSSTPPAGSQQSRSIRPRPATPETAGALPTSSGSILVRRSGDSTAAAEGATTSAAGTRSTSPRRANTFTRGSASTGDATPSPQSTSLPASEGARPAMVIDRTAFSSLNFSSPLLVNNISNRVLFPILAKHRANMKRGGTAGPSGGGGAGSREGSASTRLKASDGSALFSGPNMAAGVRKRYETDDDDAPVDHRAVAGELSATLEEAWSQVARLLNEEEATLRRQEVRCKRVEIKEKRQLATIRLGLEATSTRLQEYEDRVSNAQAATAGIEQHLSQSNARVQRGKSVSQLLRFFKAFTSIGHGELTGVLKALSKARVAQRMAVTDKWERSRVSPFNPRYFTTVVAVTPAGPGVGVGGGGGGGEEEGGSALKRDGEQPQQRQDPLSARAKDSPAAPRRRAKNVFRHGGRRARGNSSSNGSSRVPSGAASVGARSHANSGDEGGGAAAADEDDGKDEDEDDVSSEDSVDEAGQHIMDVKLHRAEAAAVAAGLDRMFAVRSYTEAQVEWCQKLTLLANELGDLASNTRNIEAYVAWLRQELVADLFHVIARFNDFYDSNSQSAVHMSYGRALLKTMELVSRLYTTLTPSNDALLTVFFSRAVNDLGVALFSEYSPRPLPSQPPLPNPTPLLAMDHFRRHTDGELRKAFHFLLEQVRRDVTVVETIFGMTSTARQQLLSQVTEGVVKRFIEQQIKLAETFSASILASEGGLSPRSRRKCGVRVADAIAYAHTVEVRLFTFFQSFIEELKKSFDASEVEFLNRFTEGIFAHRAAYSESRDELHLLDRYYTLIEETYTRSLHPIPDECFDLREAHMQKTKEMLDRLTEVATRVKTYAMPKDVGSYVLDIVQLALTRIGAYLGAELGKTLDALRADRDSWRQRPKSEDELLRPPKPESQQCGLRMLLFAQSSLMSLNDNIAVVCIPLLQSFPRLVQDVDEARGAAMESLDDRAERLLNMCAQAIIVRSLSILLHYQLKTDYMPRENKNKEVGTIAPPCTRACTLFCYYVTRQFEEAKEFIRLSNGQVSQRQATSQVALGPNPSISAGGNSGDSAGGGGGGGGVSGGSTAMSGGGGAGEGSGGPVPSYYGGAAGTSASSAAATSGVVSAVRARARTMNLQQLVYGDGGPSSFVRTVGVCLHQGIAAHLKSFTVNDRGALVYKQDVSAFKEAMVPLTSTPGLGGAVVETLFQMLKETSSLLIMPLDHIKEVKESGTLKLMSNEEKLRFIRIRQDVKDGLRVIRN